MKRLGRRQREKRSILMIDIGGGSVKMMRSRHREIRRFDTGAQLTAPAMAAEVARLTNDWSYDAISIGYPGPIRDGRPAGEPPRVGTGWVTFDYENELGCPVRMINDAALQALAAYRGGRMLFIGLGTGLGSTFIADDVLIPLELGWLRFDARRSLLQQLADNGPQRLGLSRWRSDVIQSVGNLAAAFDTDDVVLGGGNAVRLPKLPRRWRVRTNAQALLGAERLWGDLNGVIAVPRGTVCEIRGISSIARRFRSRR